MLLVLFHKLDVVFVGFVSRYTKADTLDWDSM